MQPLHTSQNAAPALTLLQQTCCATTLTRAHLNMSMQTRCSCAHALLKAPEDTSVRFPPPTLRISIHIAVYNCPTCQSSKAGKAHSLINWAAFCLNSACPLVQLQKLYAECRCVLVNAVPAYLSSQLPQHHACCSSINPPTGSGFALSSRRDTCAWPWQQRCKKPWPQVAAGQLPAQGARS